MRKSLRALLCASAFLGFAASAFASGAQVAPHWVTEQVKWRTSTTSSTDKNFNQQCGCVDSNYFSKVGKGVLAGAASGLADTTAPISTQGWIYGMVSAPTTPSSDSTAWMRLMLVDHGTSGAPDSLYVIPQVSINGVVWEFPNLVKDAAASGSPFAAASILTEAIPVKLLVGKSGTILFHSALSGRTSCDIQGLGTWPLIRFIVLNDISSATTVLHSFECYIGHYSSDERPAE